MEKYNKLYSITIDYVSKSRDYLMNNNINKAKKTLSELERKLLTEF